MEICGGVVLPVNRCACHPRGNDRSKGISYLENVQGLVNQVALDGHSRNKQRGDEVLVPGGFVSEIDEHAVIGNALLFQRKHNLQPQNTAGNE